MSAVRATLIVVAAASVMATLREVAEAYATLTWVTAVVSACSAALVPARARRTVRSLKLTAVISMISLSHLMNSCAVRPWLAATVNVVSKLENVAPSLMVVAAMVGLTVGFFVGWGVVPHSGHTPGARFLSVTSF